MKRIIALVLTLVMAISISASALEMEAGLIQTTVRVNINEGTVTKNDEAVTITTAPYIDANGVSMMEFYTLAEAMGAEATDDGTNLVVTYEGVEMHYVLGSADATITGQTITMPAAPVRSENGVIMVPIRFISEALGADVTYDGEKGEIVIVAAGGLDEGINFMLLFKYSGKTKVGHSGEGWRFTKTDNFDMSDENYGYGYEFAMDDIMFSLRAVKNTDNKSLELVYSNLQNNNYYLYYDYGVMYDKGKANHNGVPYAYVKSRTTDTIAEDYAYVTEKYIYYITIERTFEYFATAKDSSVVNDFLASLEFNYTGGDEENTVDIANVNLEEIIEEDKKEEYTDGNYSWSIKLNGTWEINEYYGFYNRVTITRESELNEEEEDDYSSIYDYYYDYDYSIDSDYVPDSVITVTTLSNPENQSVSAWAQYKRSLCEQGVNSEKCTISPVQDTTINGLSAKVFVITQNSGENTSVYKYYYLNNGLYRYQIVLDYDKREESQAGFLESAEAVIQSFKPGDINAEEVGGALEADSEIELLNVTSELKGEKYEVTYPCIWKVEESDSGLSIGTISGYSSTSEILGIIFPQLSLLFAATSDVSASVSEVSLMYYDDELNKQYYTADEYMKKNIASMLNTSNSYYQIETIGDIEDAQAMGRAAKKVELKMIAEGETYGYYTIYYIPDGEEKLLTLMKVCAETVKNTAYEAAMDKAIASLKTIE